MSSIAEVRKQKPKVVQVNFLREESMSSGGDLGIAFCR